MQSKDMDVRKMLQYVSTQTGTKLPLCEDLKINKSEYYPADTFLKLPGPRCVVCLALKAL